MEKVARHYRAVIAIAVLSAGVLAAGCGGDDETTSETTTTTAAENSALCSDLTKLQDEISSIDNIDPSSITIDQLNQKITEVTSTANQIASDASEAGSAAAADIKSDVNNFRDEVKSASGEGVAQGLVTVGTALDSLQLSVSKSTSDLGCS